jgi:hypothetical protein
METKWHFESNQFETVTANNYKLAESISKQHINALRNEILVPVIGTMYNNFLPLRSSFETNYILWMSKKAARKSATLKVRNLILEISSKKIEDWDIKIQNIHRQDSEEYMSLMPNRRNPFQKGTYDERITYLKTLAKNLEGNAALSEVYEDINLFIGKIDLARNEKQELDETISKQSTLVDQTRFDCAVMMYSNLGGLMQLFCKTPEAISRFFDLEAIRAKPRKANDEVDEFSLKIETASTIEAGIMFTDKTRFLLFNNSNVPLYVYTGLENDSPNPITMLCLAPDEEREVSPSELGMPGSRFLFIVNKDMKEEGEMAINLIAGE